MFSDAAAE